MRIHSIPLQRTFLLAQASTGQWESVMGWILERPHVSIPLSLAFLAGGAWLAHILTKHLIVPAIRTLVRRSPMNWGDTAMDHGALNRLAFVIPLLVVHQGLGLVRGLPPSLSDLLKRVAVACVAVAVVRSVAAGLQAVNTLYSRRPQAKDRPIKGLLQVVSIVAHFAAGLFIVATLLDRSPVILLSGLGAMTAILMLVFRDSILSLVAGIQITANNLIRVGDWIEMPQFNADGDVIDIALNTISVQNWDKTITVIPAHKFLENSFKNWRGMFEIGGRRIKRSIYLDVSSIRFLTDEEVEYFSRFHLLKDYIEQKKRELAEYNQGRDVDPRVPVNERRLTNVGTFRAYVTNYLAGHPGIHKTLFTLVRQLQPTASGLPLEIYAFTNDTAWKVYEGIQADVFDHLFAAIPQFGLRVFQNPSGADFAGALGGSPEMVRENFLSEPPPASLTGGRSPD